MSEIFKQKEIIEFLTRIIKNTDTNNMKDAKESIDKFREYLELTVMCSEDTLAFIEKTSNCLEELVAIYKKTGVCDLNMMIDNQQNNNDVSKESEETQVLTKKRSFTKPYQEKHYERYVPTSSSSSSASSFYGSSCFSRSYGTHC